MTTKWDGPEIQNINYQTTTKDLSERMKDPLMNKCKVRDSGDWF